MSRFDEKAGGGKYNDRAALIANMIFIIMWIMPISTDAKAGGGGDIIGFFFLPMMILIGIPVFIVGLVATIGVLQRSAVKIEKIVVGASFAIGVILAIVGMIKLVTW